MLKKTKNFTVKIIILLIDSSRALLGPTNTCIYTITCRDFAKDKLEKRSLFISIPLIMLRLLSCNPITGIILKIKNKYFKLKT